MSIRSVLSIVFVAFSAGCGGSVAGSSPNMVSAPADMGGQTIRGSLFTIGDSLSTVVTTGSGNTSESRALVLVSNRGGVCAAFGAGKETGDTKYMMIALQDVDINTSAASAPRAPGSYVVTLDSSGNPPRWATISYWMTDADCSQSAGADGIAGTVTLTSVDGARLAGRFDVTLDTGEQIAGNFGSTPCQALDRVASGSQSIACQSP